ncbi:MAG TPA: PIG-L deacetylase family protein [Mycobacteriales bacterium]|nr:PIG-L deacetylase family protein [Mycobacteriales bacterium]
MTYSPAPGTDGIERILVITAHPDDADFGAAGTIATWTDAGVEVAYCIATRGDAGGFDDTPREQMRQRREEEQRAAGAAVGVTDITFLDYPDGRLYVTHELRRDITRQIRRFRPQRVLTLSPERDWSLIARAHPDHLAVGAAAVAAVYPDARNEFAHPELLLEENLKPWTVGELWLSGGPAEDRYVDVTGTFDRKLTALHSHLSQTGHIEEFDDNMRRAFGGRAVSMGLPEGHFVETFNVVNTG